MNRNSIKDDELENVNGGTRKEIYDLSSALLRSEADVSRIQRFLEQHGIIALLNDDEYTTNMYKNMKTNEKITHEELIELIKKNRWHL